ncbi:hypothetical protein FFWV33_08715 [Flavobacterium faecale]|uniref:DUF748 domain-containing protein n=1 Tax=Flavobacterium faecale TaxID=1355330 RepID=A0A2S1LCY8_9FLAO|nr:DUF748 domain-containing protein [Flavobacterium faecale]AWG21609.1 hypothetical protein FFWV33_08715 [Flavobacterium faecale]
MDFINNKKAKKILILVVLMLSVLVGVHFWAKSKVTRILEEKIPATIALKYTDLDLNVVFGNVSLHDAFITVRSEDKTKTHTFFKVKAVKLKGLGYWDALFNDRISFRKIVLVQPKITHDPTRRDKVDKKADSTKGKKVIAIKELEIRGGSLVVLDAAANDIATTVVDYDLSISDIELGPETKHKLPFDFKNFKFKGKHISTNNSPFEKFIFDELTIDEGNARVTGFHIRPSYSKAALSNVLQFERDHVALDIPKINLEHIQLNRDKNRFQVAVDQMQLQKVNLQVYRDKLVADDLSKKPLYSESLRKLPFDLLVKETTIEDGFISYAELVDSENKAGELTFSSVQATVKSISNAKDAAKTEIDVQAKFMKQAPLNLHWNFDVNNKNNALWVSGSLKNLPASILNPFLKPNMNVVSEGKIDEMYFKFQANKSVSNGEMKMKYDNFKFNILQNDSSKVNKLLTAIGSLFFKSDSEGDSKADFRYGTIEAERDQTKSFFNYLWISVKSGVVSTLTGNGEKEK